jgi:hypothetical protein
VDWLLLDRDDLLLSYNLMNLVLAFLDVCLDVTLHFCHNKV